MRANVLLEGDITARGIEAGYSSRGFYVSKSGTA
jgi:hypothetical protein